MTLPDRYMLIGEAFDEVQEVTYDPDQHTATVNWSDKAPAGRIKGWTYLNYKDGSRLRLEEPVQWHPGGRPPNPWHTLGVTYEAQYLTLQPVIEEELGA